MISGNKHKYVFVIVSNLENSRKLFHWLLYRGYSNFIYFFLTPDVLSQVTKERFNTRKRVSQGGPCSLVPFQNCPMFPCSHTFSECFRTVIFRILFPCSQKVANVPLFPSIFCQCSLVPPNPWETLKQVSVNLC